MHRWSCFPSVSVRVRLLLSSEQVQRLSLLDDSFTEINLKVLLNITSGGKKSEDMMPPVMSDSQPGSEWYLLLKVID